MSLPRPVAPTVSFDSEELILVDADDRATGTLRKDRCHDGEGLLHRAFSVFLFNSAGEVLMQQRAAGKRLWPGFWSNSCCSHPRAGEDMAVAVPRRLEQELGITAEPTFVYKFEYKAHYLDIGTEHELCWVFVGRTNDEPQPNPNEIEDWRWVGVDALDAELADTERYTPWCRQEWSALRGPYADALKELVPKR